MFEVGDVIADTDAGQTATVLEVDPVTEVYTLKSADDNTYITCFDDPYLTYPCPECGGAEISTGQVFGSDIRVFVCEKCGEEWT